MSHLPTRNATPRSGRLAKFPSRRWSASHKGGRRARRRRSDADATADAAAAARNGRVDGAADRASIDAGAIEGTLSRRRKHTGRRWGKLDASACRVGIVRSGGANSRVRRPDKNAAVSRVKTDLGRLATGVAARELPSVRLTTLPSRRTRLAPAPVAAPAPAGADQCRATPNAGGQGQ